MGHLHNRQFQIFTFSEIAIISPPASVRAGFTLPYHVVKEGDGEVSVCVGAFEPEKFGANFTLMANTKDGTLGILHNI